MTNLKPLTQEDKKRVIQAMSETSNLLNKELAYSKDLQKPERIQFYLDHIKTLNGYIQNGWSL